MSLQIQAHLKSSLSSQVAAEEGNTSNAIFSAICALITRLTLGSN